MKFAVIFLSVVFAFSSGLFSYIEVPQYDAKKAELGKKIYFETKFNMNKLSCDSCHNIYLNQSGSSVSTNAPTILNSAFSTTFSPNNSISNLKEKIKNSLTSKKEIDANPDTIVVLVNRNSQYISEFKSLYKDGVTFENIADALENFVKTLVTPNSKFDKFLKGEAGLNKDEQKGYELFLSLGCASCHNGVNFGSNNYQTIPSSGAIIKVPTLRNITKTSPYTNGNTSLSETISNLSIKKVNMRLRDDEVYYIVKFLETLSGELHEK